MNIDQQPLINDHWSKTIDVDKWVKNLSDRQLTQAEKNILAKRLNFAVALWQIPLMDLITATETAIRNNNIADVEAEQPQSSNSVFKLFFFPYICNFDRISGQPSCLKPHILSNTINNVIMLLVQCFLPNYRNEWETIEWNSNVNHFHTWIYQDKAAFVLCHVTRITHTCGESVEKVRRMTYGSCESSSVLYNSEICHRFCMRELAG